MPLLDVGISAKTKSWQFHRQRAKIGGRRVPDGFNGPIQVFATYKMNASIPGKSPKASKKWLRDLLRAGVYISPFPFPPFSGPDSPLLEFKERTSLFFFKIAKNEGIVRFFFLKKRAGKVSLKKIEKILKNRKKSLNPPIKHNLPISLLEAKRKASSMSPSTTNGSAKNQRKMFRTSKFAL